MMTDDNPTAFFWEIAEPILAQEDISKGTMMGFPCLRTHGAFFASADQKSGNLIVKLPATYVNDLIEVGLGQSFAPAGHRFKEWVMISDRDGERWKTLMAEAQQFVASSDK